MLSLSLPLQWLFPDDDGGRDEVVNGNIGTDCSYLNIFLIMKTVTQEGTHTILNIP